MTSVILVISKKPRLKRGFFGLFCGSDGCAPRLAKGLVLGGQRPNQRIVLTRLLRGWELNTVGNKAHLRSLLGDKIPYLNQLLREDLRGGDQRLQGIRRFGHHFLIHFVEDRLEIVALFQRGT